MSKSKAFPIHPAAGIFPMMADDALQELAADIKQNGLINPIVLAEWIDVDGEVVEGILDGRNRYQACQLAGVEPEFQKANGHDPLAFVVSLNVKRRNLTASQKAIAAAEAWALAEIEGKVLRHGGQRSSAQAGHLIRRPREYFGEMFGVGKNYVNQAKELLEYDPLAAQQVKDGGPTLLEKYREFELRQGKDKTKAARLHSLRSDRPDLAEQVEREALSLEDAEKKAKAEEEDEKQKRWALTKNLIDSVKALDRDQEPENVKKFAEMYDPVQAEMQQETVTPERLLRVAEFCTLLAKALSGDEVEEDNNG